MGEQLTLDALPAGSERRVVTNPTPGAVGALPISQPNGQGAVICAVPGVMVSEPKKKKTPEELAMTNPAALKRVDPYSAPTFDKFQAIFRGKYGRMPRATEIGVWYERHPGAWEERHGSKKGGRR